ncbi:unnamed protein product [Linum trigynum]
MIFIITLLVGFLSAATSHKKICSTVRVDDPTTFSGFVDQALKILVVFTSYPPVQGKPTGRVVTFPPMSPRGAVEGRSTCEDGVIGAACNRCLAHHARHLQKCKNFTSGGSAYEGLCDLEFHQI